MPDNNHIIELREWDYDNKCYIEKGEVTTHDVARSMTYENFVELFDHFLNLGGKDFSSGKKIGEELQSTHPTLQGLAIRFSLGIIVGLSDQKYTDARNEMPVEMGQKIKAMLDAGELKMGYMI